METHTLPYVKQIANSNLQYDSGGSNQRSGTTGRSGMGSEVDGRSNREGTFVYVWLIHVVVWQYCKYCKAIIFQLKIKKIKKLN